MKITPKLLKGGSFDAFFTTYNPILIQAPTQTKQESPRGKQTTDNEKGALTEKDFFTMIKDIDGLPNEMSAIVSNLMNTFKMSNLTGINTEDLATTYLLNLYLIKIASLNKKKYDDALSLARENGALAEPAISMDGKVVVLNKDGLIETISLDTFMKGDTYYLPLTVSNLAKMRAYTPQLANNLSIFDIINNSIGFESFQKLIGEAKLALGTDEVSRNGLFTNEGLASKGLALLNTLLEDDRVRALGSAVTAEGLYEYNIIDKSQLRQLNALTDYMVSIFPDRAKTWAALKMGSANKNEATKGLIFKYLFSGTDQSHKFDILRKSNIDKVTGTNKLLEDPKKGFWSQVQSGHGGEDFRFTIMTKGNSMSVNGKFYGTTPGLESNKSLGDYINNSNVGYLIKNNKNITLGDKKVSIDSWNDIMVNAFSGAAVVTLPIKPDGTVDLNLSERWTSILEQMNNSGLDPNTSEYKLKQKLLMSENHIDDLLNLDGTLRRNRFGLFLVLEGYTSERADAVLDNKKVSFKDILSDFIIPAGDDSKLYDTIKRGLSNKDRGEYEIRSGIFNDELFKGNIYIPINTNPISGYNADLNEIKESTSYLYEKAQQLRSTDSSEL